MGAPRDVRGVDVTTQAFKEADFAHHEVHDGDHFYYTERNSIDNGNSVDLMIDTSNMGTKRAHLLFTVDGLFVTQVRLYEGADRNLGAGYTEQANNRNSGTALLALAPNGGGGATDGTVIFTWLSGVSTGTGAGRVIQGASARADQELILKVNTKYILRITSSTNSNLTNTFLSWYEHTDETM